MYDFFNGDGMPSTGGSRRQICMVTQTRKNGMKSIVWSESRRVDAKAVNLKVSTFKPVNVRFFEHSGFAPKPVFSLSHQWFAMGDVLHDRQLATVTA